MRNFFLKGQKYKNKLNKIKTVIFVIVFAFGSVAYADSHNVSLRANSYDSDFGIPTDKQVDYEMKDYTMTLSPELSREMIKKSGPRPTFWERVSVWFENAFIWIASIPDRISFIYAKLTNNTEMQIRAEEAIQEYTKSMYYNKAAIGL